MRKPLLKVDNLAVSFKTARPQFVIPHSMRNLRCWAVRGISLEYYKGQLLGIVGESGSGKSVFVNAFLRLLGENAEVSGKAMFDGVDLLSCSESQISKIRGRSISMIFQNSAAVLNPVLTIGQQVEEAVGNADAGGAGAGGLSAKQKARLLLEQVNLKDIESIVGRYPHQLSGGMCQRIGIAIALAGGAGILIADEPTTALDAATEQEIISLLKKLNKEKDMGIILISHNLKMVSEICDDIVVMYAGSEMETGTTQEILSNPLHPYTKALLKCQETLHESGKLFWIEGTLPSPYEEVSACPFSPRCEKASPKCFSEVPPLANVDGSSARKVACFES